MIILFVLIWRIVISLVSAVAVNYYPYTPTFPYAEAVLAHLGPRWISTWAQFDGIHYLTIITNGYHGAEFIQTFFPTYPLLVRLLGFSLLNPLAVGIGLSTLCFTVGLFLLYRLVLLDDSKKIAGRTILLILVAPTSFYFTSLYTEGLFFLLVVSSFYAARKGHWWIAGLLGAAAASTRLTGIFLVPGLMHEYFEQKKNPKQITSVATLLPSFGLLGFMTYLWKQFDDSLLFYHAQASFNTGRETNRIILLPQVFYRYIKMFLTVPPHNHIFFIIIQEFAAAFFGLVGIIVGWFTVRRSYIIFAALSYLIPTATGTFSSLPRYILPLFPLFMVVAKRLPDKLFPAWVAISAVTLIINVILFTRGLWVA